MNHSRGSRSRYTKSHSRSHSRSRSPKASRKRRCPSAYNLFVGSKMKRGMSMKEAAKMWNKKDHSSKVKSRSRRNNRSK